ncbi:MAG TPA: Fur family transcriptional regulator [Ilumatobacteraceae bacterium]|nr:Fur family transcriptional regulator [Ilumatobacteraceae bacterium]
MSPARAEIHRTVRDRLDENDQRYTSGRRVVVDALASADGPVTLPELIVLAPALAQSSAYRNLAVMEQVGVVRRLVHSADHARYELAEDLTEHHHHLICESCGTVRDVTLTPALERRLDDAFGALSDAEGFEATHHTIDLYGRCANCQT